MGAVLTHDGTTTLDRLFRACVPRHSLAFSQLLTPSKLLQQNDYVLDSFSLRNNCFVEVVGGRSISPGRVWRLAACGAACASARSQVIGAPFAKGK